MRRAAPALIAFLLGLGGVVHAEPAWRFAEVGDGRGLDATVVPAMLVDRDGVLWVGSREGLFRYDGYAATVHRPTAGDPGSLSDVDVRALYEARDGTLWVSTNTAGLNRLDRRTGRFTRFAHDSADPRSLSDSSVFGVAEDARGRVWVGSQRGLNRLEADGKHFTRFFHEPGRAGSLANDWVYAVHSGRSGALWIATVGGGIDRWRESEGTFENFRLSTLTGASRPVDDVFALHEGEDGRLWAGTRGGLVVVDVASGTARLVEIANLPGVQPLVTSMHADRRHRLWLTTMNAGLIMVDLRTGRVEATDAEFSAGPSRETPPLLSVSSTAHQLLLGTWGRGVFRTPLELPPFGLLADVGPRRLRNRNVTALLPSDEPGRPWVGSFGGGTQRIDVATGKALQTIGASSERIGGAGVMSLARMPGGRLFAGSTEGLYSFDADGDAAVLEQHDPARPEGIGRGYVPALLPARDGALWVGVGGSGLHLRDRAGRFRAFRHEPTAADSLSGDYVTALADARQGRLWVGTRSNGLNLCRTEPWSCQRFAAGGSGQLAHHHVTEVRADSDGFIWVATDGGGVQRLRETGQGATAAGHWGAAQGLIDDGIMAVELDRDGSLWLSTRRGLARLDPSSGRVVNHVQESGLRVEHFNTGASAADATHLYFGSVEGLVSIPKGTPFATRPATPVTITAVERLGGEGGVLAPAKLVDGFETPHGEGLAIEFAVLDFAETPHEYAYRMESGAQWTSLGQRRHVTFLGLDPGSYRFEVRGRDVFGQWSTSSALAFRVVPPLWMRTWFRVAVALAIVVLALGLHLARTRALQARNAVLEGLKQQRELALERAKDSQRSLEEAYAGLRQLTSRLESAKEDERASISRELHDEFGQTLTAAKLTLQMLRRGTDEPAVAEGLAQSVALVDGMIRQARDIARGLRPPLLDEAGLVAALEHHLGTTAARSGVPIALHAALEPSSVPADLQLTVFRIVQEAVSNALRHAQARRVDVRLALEGPQLRLVVEDDGVGFDPDQVAQRARRGEHLGLLGMNERVRNAGGTLELKSRRGGGSRIDVLLPVVHADASAPLTSNPA